jgi:AP2-like factor, ANT lineage
MVDGKQEEEAVEEYHVAAIKLRGTNAISNFELNRYDLDAIGSSDLPIGAFGKEIKVGSSASNRQQPSSCKISNAVPQG